MDLLEYWYGTESGITRKFIAENHTMHPYVNIVYPHKFRQQVNAVIDGEYTPETFDKTGTQRTHRLWPKFLRYCPECVRDDIDAFGETYWHRIHQLPAVLYCTKHHVRLNDSNVKVTGSHMGFHPASAKELVEKSDTNENDSFEQYKGKFLKIGVESEWLLKHGASIDWEFDLHAKYKMFFRDKGIATVQGVSDYDRITDAFEDYWGQDFLECLKLELSDEREWVRQIYEAGMISYKPIYHILLMCFLCGSVEAFLDYVPLESIFGNSPWACINPICEHYGIDGVETVDIRYINGIAIGFFKCSACGMTYKQRYWRKQMSQLYIVEYGDLWVGRMIHCLRDERLDIPTTAEALKSKPHAVKWQMKKLGIFGNPEYHRKSAASIRLKEAKSVTHAVVLQMESSIKNETINLPEVNSKPQRLAMLPIYRAQVLQLFKRHEELTSDILKQYAPRAYKYLYKFDLDWLHKHMVLNSNRQQQREEDAEMLRRIQEAVIAICSSGMPKRQITPGFIAVSAGYPLAKLDYLASKRPLTKSYIDSVAESRTDWLRRRITAIAQERRAFGAKITLADIKREMSLKPNTFVKYKIFLNELIDELNG